MAWIDVVGLLKDSFNASPSIRFVPEYQRVLLSDDYACLIIAITIRPLCWEQAILLTTN